MAFEKFQIGVREAEIEFDWEGEEKGSSNLFTLYARVRLIHSPTGRFSVVSFSNMCSANLRWGQREPRPCLWAGNSEFQTPTTYISVRRPLRVHRGQDGPLAYFHLLIPTCLFPSAYFHQLISISIYLLFTVYCFMLLIV